MASAPRQYQSPGQLEVKRAWERGAPWFQGQRAYARLLRDLEEFRVELALLEQHSHEPDKTWAAAAHDQLNNVTRYLEKRDVEGGWLCLHAAQRHSVFGLAQSELALKASTIRLEAQKGKLPAWRTDAITLLLSVKDDKLTPHHLAEAMMVRDEFYANQYHKIWLMGDQINFLIWICSAAIVLFLLMIGFVGPIQGNLSHWGFRMVSAVLLVGVMGAAFGAGQALIAGRTTEGIPERVANYLVTVARTLFGAVAGLAGYAFLDSHLLNIQIRIGDNENIGALAVAFLFGYAGERLVARVAGSVDRDNSPARGHSRP